MAENEMYDSTVRKLIARRDELQLEVDALDQAIKALSSVGSPAGMTTKAAAASASPLHPARGAIYSLISIRWACLWILSQANQIGLSTSSVAALLEKGGRTSKAGRFASTVSAVLSNMKIKGEVEQSGNYWLLTQSGTSALTAIEPRLKLLADQYLKYTKEDIQTMSLTKSKALINSNDEAYTEACDFYFGGAAAVPNGGPY